jgi:hypothetical protein
LALCIDYASKKLKRDIQDSRSKIQDPRYKIQDTRAKT